MRMVLMDHGNGVISHVQCGFNYFDPYGHEGKGQEKHTIQIWGTHGNMALVGYDWAPHGVDMVTHDHEAPQRFVPDPGTYVWQEGATCNFRIASYRNRAFDRSRTCLACAGNH